MCMGERAKQSSAEQEELCPKAANAAGSQQISTPAVQPFRPWAPAIRWRRHLHMAGIGKALGQCWRKRLFLICPSQMSELKLESHASFWSQEES